MHADIVNMALAFVEGFALIISPCILPILPIILSGSLTGSKSRPLGIITGFVITFAIVTLFSRALIAFAHVSQDAIRNVSFALLLLFGLMMLSTRLTEKFNLFTQGLTRVGASLHSANNPQGGFWGGILFGALVGIIWTPCAGPILAAVVVQVVIQHTTSASLLTVIAFGIGAGLPMLLIALIGRQIVNQFNFFRDKAVRLRQLLGLIIIATVLYLIYDSSALFTYGQTSKPQPATPTVGLINKLEHPFKAPEIAGIEAWVNSPPLTLSALKGKVVLIDFWTYSCINCLRTLPYLKAWYAKYHDKGLEIIGVHSPEFEFEHNLENVKMAVAKYGILYPVALDNRFVTWQNYQNQYWPAHYLINKDGDVVYEHFGEGEYDVTENNIRFLLGLRHPGVPAAVAEENYASAQTPETYLGYTRAENYASPEVVVKDKPSVYHYPPTLAQHHWALNGKWIIMPDRIISGSAGASLKLHFNAGKIYAVMGLSSATLIAVKVLLDGQLPLTASGSDVKNGVVEVRHNQLYSLVEFHQTHNGELELTAAAPGLEIYTFTFGA